MTVSQSLKDNNNMLDYSMKRTEQSQTDNYKEKQKEMIKYIAFGAAMFVVGVYVGRKLFSKQNNVEHLGSVVSRRIRAPRVRRS